MHPMWNIAGADGVSDPRRRIRTPEAPSAALSPRAEFRAAARAERVRVQKLKISLVTIYTVQRVLKLVNIEHKFLYNNPTSLPFTALHSAESQLRVRLTVFSFIMMLGFA